MDKLKLVSAGMVILGIITFIAGFVTHMNALVEYGMYIGIAGVMANIVIFVMGSTSKTIQKPN